MTVNSLWTDPGPVKVHSASPRGSPGPRVGNLWPFKESRSGRGLHSDEHEWDDWKHKTLLVWQFDLKRSSKRLFPAIQWNSGVSSPTSSIESRFPPEKWFRNFCSSSDTTTRLLIGVFSSLFAELCFLVYWSTDDGVTLSPADPAAAWIGSHSEPLGGPTLIYSTLGWSGLQFTPNRDLDPADRPQSCVGLVFCVAVVSKQERDNHKTVRHKNGGIFLSQSLFAEEFKFFSFRPKVHTEAAMSTYLLAFFLRVSK